MTVHPEEVRLARVYQQQAAFEGLSREQIHRIMDRGRELHRWFKAHHRLHCLIGAVLLTCMLAGDFLVMLKLPLLWLVPGGKNPLHLTLLAGVVSGALHTWILYSLGIFTMHEGAAHHAIFPPLGPLSRAGNFLAGNLCRITGADPEYYAARHMIHHSKFGTEEDAEFLNFVSPRRYWASFLPLAGILNFSDFVVHRPLTYTKSRLPSVPISYLYHGVYGYFVYRAWGLPFLLIELFFFTHIGFYLDRLRQFTEHNLMPLDNMNGSRSFGLGFWGWLVGGGPWGTPCHWEHHLVASIPWYQQIVLHRFVVRLLTPQQRKQFLLEPFIGFPKLWWRLIRESNALIAAK